MTTTEHNLDAIANFANCSGGYDVPRIIVGIELYKLGAKSPINT